MKKVFAKKVFLISIILSGFFYAKAQSDTSFSIINFTIRNHNVCFKKAELCPKIKVTSNDSIVFNQPVSTSDKFHQKVYSQESLVISAQFGEDESTYVSDTFNIEQETAYYLKIIFPAENKQGTIEEIKQTGITNELIAELNKPESEESSSPILIYIILILLIISMWRIFQKAGQPGWACIIPVYNIIVFLEIVKKPWWWLFLMLIPYLQIIWIVWSINLLSKSFGKNEGFTVGLIFLSFIFFPILAFGTSEYEGQSTEKDYLNQDKKIKINYDTKVKKLIKKMDDNRSEKQARDEMLKLGDMAVGSLKSILQHDKSVYRRKNATEFLGEIKNPGAIGVLISALQDNESILNISRELAEYLVHGKVVVDQKGIDNMKSHYECSEEQAMSLIKKAFMVQAESIEDEDLVNWLATLLSESDWPKIELTISSYAAKALSVFDDSSIIEHLQSVLKDENKLLSWRAENALEIIKNKKELKTNTINKTQEPQIKEIHIYIHGGADNDVALLIVKSLRPNCLSQAIKPEIYMHTVNGEWPSEMLAYAYANLRLQGIVLSDTNCLVENGFAFNKKIFVVYLK